MENDDSKVDLINQLVGTVLNLSILSLDNILAISSNILHVSQSLLKHSD